MTDPQNLPTAYGYDALNRLTSLAFNGQTPPFTFGYDNLSRRNSLTRPNGVNTTYTYDPASNLLSILHKLGTTTIDGATYTYDDPGNRQKRVDKRTNVTLNYTYDNIYELQTAKQGTTTKESYTYDLAGNRLSSLGVSPYTYNSSNELTATPSGSYTYDANGNTLSDPSGKQYTWDFENRLVQATNPGVGTTTFKYDPLGRRVQKSSALGATNYLYDGKRLVEEVDQAGNVLARYTQGKRLDEPLAELRQTTTSYYEQDGLGSVTSLSNSAGAVAETYAYDSYGKVTASTGTLVNPFQYTGREFDSETGVYYYRARYFDPSAGRFLSQDPIRFMGGSNFYGYARNNPVRRIDPFGYRSSGWGTMYLGPDGTWYNDGPLAPSDVPEGCTAAQWAQSPGACAGPQGLDEPDPYMPPPQPPAPKKCDKQDQPPEPPYQPQPIVIDPAFSEGTCEAWELADYWALGFLHSAHWFGPEVAVLVDLGEVTSFGMNYMMCTPTIYPAR